LYFLRTLQKVNAYLIFLYFIGDKFGNTRGPQTKEEWLSAIEVMKAYLGVNKKHRLSKYILDVFIHVEDIEKECKNTVYLHQLDQDKTFLQGVYSTLLA